MGVGMGCATLASVITDPKNGKQSQLAYKKKKQTKKHTLEPKQWVAVVWACIASETGHMWPLTVLADVGGGIGVVTAGSDGVVVVVEAQRGGVSSLMVVTAKDQASEQSLKEPQKWNVKMKLKMTIFVKGREGFHFSVHFHLILNFIFEK